jgi:hypothetical protein
MVSFIYMEDTTKFITFEWPLNKQQFLATILLTVLYCIANASFPVCILRWMIYNKEGF